MKKLNFALALILGTLSLPGLLLWLFVFMPGSRDIQGAAVALLGCLGWYSLFLLCRNYQSLGKKTLPFPIFIFGTIAAITILSAPVFFWTPYSKTSPIHGGAATIILTFGIWPTLLFIQLSAMHFFGRRKNREPSP